MKDITKPERPVKELLLLLRSRGSRSCTWRSWLFLFLVKDNIYIRTVF